MLIGIMSDSHDNFRGVRDALRIFSQRGVELVLHAGDMIGSGNCYTFEGCGMACELVYGNNDGERAGLAALLDIADPPRPLASGIHRVLAEQTGAPMPVRIDLDCNLNASASFRKGASSLLSNDLVLTIGLPLVAGLNLRQFVGVVAHEFGHFSQGFGLRLSYLVRGINVWFARVVYERDAWDVALEEWSMEAEDWRVMLVTKPSLGTKSSSGTDGRCLDNPTLCAWGRSRVAAQWLACKQGRMAGWRRRQCTA